MEKNNITDAIYDTLMNNDDKLDLNQVSDQSVDAHAGIITFIYGDKLVSLSVSVEQVPENV